MSQDGIEPFYVIPVKIGSIISKYETQAVPLNTKDKKSMKAHQRNVTICGLVALILGALAQPAKAILGDSDQLSVFDPSFALFTQKIVSEQDELGAPNNLWVTAPLVPG